MYLFDQSLKLSTSARKETTIGEMTNLISINTQTFTDLTIYLNILWSAPFQIIVCVFALWKYLGVSCLVGVATMILFIPISLTICIYI